MFFNGIAPKRQSYQRMIVHVAHPRFHRAHSPIASARILNHRKLPLIVCMVFLLAISSSNIRNIKHNFIKSTTCVVGWGFQENSGFNLLPSPYLCNFLLWLGCHGSSLCRDPSQVTIACHMSNVMEIKALHLIYE